MYSQRPSPPSLKRSVSGDSQSSYASQATTVSRASSKLLFGEIPLTPATSIGGRSLRSNSSVCCNLVHTTNVDFLRFWMNDNCRENLLAHLEEEDLPNLRLVCHDFSARVAPHLFEYLTVTFKPSTFTKPARMEALSRIGYHVKTLTFHMPHDPNTFLPPIIDPITGEERQFIYEPQLQTAPHIPGKEQPPKYGTVEMTNLLIAQYPPLFHAATNVPAFVAAFSEFINLTHLKISCPGYDYTPRYRRTAVDYALISLRIAVERAPLFSLHTLSMVPIHPGGLLYLHPMSGFGSTQTSARRWCQIRRLSICMDAIDLSVTTPRVRAHNLENLRTLHAYLRTLSRGLTRLFFRWKGARGPSPLSLDREPCMQPSPEDLMHPSMAGEVRGPRPIKFPRLRYMELENAVMDSAQISDFIQKHRRSLVEFNFEDVKLREGNWDEALEPLTLITGSDDWKRNQEEVMDVPIILSPVEIVGDGTRVMGPLMEEEHHSHFSRWLMKSHANKMATSPVLGVPRRKGAKETFLGSEHMRRFLRDTLFPNWK
ncbi:uncharacterized protein EI97DRAFT_493535 [Westerdykella ornata]|uniref:Uncharacterized protein n=1 Tax=Westerdykella ornata TaxID=318751 RepID=A0A6A6JK31_WESOR|nr:uncharacterized protein EI97DRAFT_493535 [Westerdykella ornata]KAF2276951.1 hypothetical protein EI97DRAFT_493535 [Westerdykella ornata]